MKNRIIAGIFAVFFLFGGTISAAAYSASSSSQFFTAVTDLPLMPGFIEQLDENMIFDKPEGRIVETEAVGRGTREIAEGFYLETLPQLGWRFVGGHRFERGEETLEIDFSEQADYITIHVTVKPNKG
ncbi:MAG: hypothetical protein EA357_10280 [Micavibrio sp.]|nr:MAG: hypothetical protein EA357_10280 [Micavibrio sp.]